MAIRPVSSRVEIADLILRADFRPDNQLLPVTAKSGNPALGCELECVFLLDSNDFALSSCVTSNDSVSSFQRN